MDRTELMKKILKAYSQRGTKEQEEILWDAMKHMPDASLCLLALDLEIELAPVEAL